MAATIPLTSLVPVQPVFSDAERLALAGFLAGYRGLAREAYTLDLRQFTGWCRARSVPLFSVRRADIETFARELEARGRARATVTRRLCTIAGFYKYAVEEELLDHSPAAHVRRPRLDYESHATALDRNELGALLVAAGSLRAASSPKRTSRTCAASMPRCARPKEAGCRRPGDRHQPDRPVRGRPGRGRHRDRRGPRRLALR
jgi:integrase